MATQIPQDVFEFVRKVFQQCNRRISAKIAAVPNTSEPSLDLTLIEHLSQFSSPTTLLSEWTVRIDTHYLGGLGHFRRWEIADIGILLFLRQAGQLVTSKVGLLQSKRLYPDNGDILEETAADYQIGFARLVPSGPHVASMQVKHAFSFSASSRYGALRVRDGQWNRIVEYQKQRTIPVYYLLYNPWTIPFHQTVPLYAQPTLSGTPSGGCRVISADTLVESQTFRPDNYTPRFRDICGLLSGGKANYCGWKLEHFVSGLLLGCSEGRVFQDPNEVDLESLFFRRSGPIAAAIGINVEMPESLEWD